MVFASPDWTLQQAAETMVRSGFRHLVVVEGGEVIGLLSMRDIVRVWADAPAPVARHRRPHQPEPARIPRSPA